jgi:P-type Ca2+ transporter type 2C
VEDWHAVELTKVLEELHSGSTGLTTSNAAERQKKYGLNLIEEKNNKSVLAILANQFKSYIVWILLGAAAVSFWIALEKGEELIDVYVILVILVFNTLLGFYQEFKAEKSIEALKRLAALKAKVRRDGTEQHIDAKDLVPGDIILLEAGDRVPADSRIIECMRLETDESSLTGESMTVKKTVDPVGAKAPLADRVCMVYSGSSVTAGHGIAIVVSTGMSTEIGRIAGLVQSVEDKETPLQQKLAQLAELLAIGTLVICAIVFVLSLFQASRIAALDSSSIMASFMMAVSLAVAAIPEGLPAVVTICLALGVQRMVRKNALVRVLPSVETLGSCDVICTDKTGTLTYNQMTVRQLYIDGRTVEVSGQGYVPEGIFEEEGKQVQAKSFERLFKAAALCNDAKLNYKDNAWRIMGDPTEAALLVVARKAGITQERLELPRIDEIPFDSGRKMMTTLHKEKVLVAYCKGAPEILLERCSRIEINGKVRTLTAKDKRIIHDQNQRMAEKALRVLGFAYKGLKDAKEANVESKMIFIGLVGMIDPPRREISDSIRRCKEAGIRVVMITGDHKATAIAIGKELGLEGNVLTGPELDEMESLDGTVEETLIYARVSPQHKLKIISALKAKGHVVAMTGDGVNDAPALKRADIGIAMGITGTDVAKEASDMILTDDNFTSIVNAVEEGRGIYDNIRKFVKYLLSSNFGEVLTVLAATLIGYVEPIIPLAAIHLLWINLLTDGLPALALGVEPTDPEVMRQPPRKQKDSIISKDALLEMLPIGVIMAAGTLFLFSRALSTGHDVAYASTIAFMTLVMFQLFNVFNARSRQSVFLTPINNIWLVLAVASSFMLQLLVLYTPLSGFLKAVPLNLLDWIAILGISSTVLVFEEIRKFVVRRSHGRA